MAAGNTPVREGRVWVFPDGKRLPVISGGAGEDDPTEPPEPTADPPAPTADDLAAVKAALKKANEEAAASRLKLKEIEDRDKSDSEKLSERAATAERRAEEAEARALRLEVAAAKGLTPGQAKRLAGSTLEELEADADELLADFAPTTGESEPPLGGRPKERLRGGGSPAEEPEETDPRKLAALISRR
jgi:hypothetical protein